MSSAGHILDMINRMKQNRSQRTSNKAKFKENDRERIFAGYVEHQRPVFKIIPKKELLKIKEHIRNRAKKEHRKALIFNMALIGITTIVIIRLLIWIN